MKKIITTLLLAICCTSSFAFSFQYPEVSLFFPKGLNKTVYYGETLKIPLQMNYTNLRVHKEWTLPPGVGLENYGGVCPAISGDTSTYWDGTCLMNLVIVGDKINKLIHGNLNYHVYGKDGSWPHKHKWDRNYQTPAFSIYVIPHPLSLSPAPIQEATANSAFIYNLKSVVQYYEENQEAGAIEAEVIPTEQDGLRFDKDSFSITGTPERFGPYEFKVAIKNNYSSAEPIPFKIEVGVNPKDRPRFKANARLLTAIANTKYSMNLLELIEYKKTFMVSNQIAFRIDSNVESPSWLHIAKDDATRLEGEVPEGLTGEVRLTLYAMSNTGGDSEPLELSLPIAIDSAQKPIVKPFKLEAEAGSYLQEDIAAYIDSPSFDPNLKITLDKIEPKAFWLSVSSVKPTVLEGRVPRDAVGKQYNITLRAVNLIGGSSEAITIPLQILNENTTKL